MKQSILIRSAFVLSFLLLIVISQAQEAPFKMSILPDSTGERFVVTVFNPEKKKLQLSIYHAVFGYLYSQQINDAHLHKIFNLSEADDGLYNVEIRNGRERYTRQIHINTYTAISRKMELK